MDTWSRDGPLLPRAPAADPGPGQWLRLAGQPDEARGDAAGSTRDAPVNAPAARPAQRRSPASDPDDAKTAPQPAIKVRPAQPASPQRTGPGPSQGAASGLPREGSAPPPPALASAPGRMSADPDDAKTAPQPAIRVRPTPEVRPAGPRRDPGPVRYDQDGFVPGLSRPKEPYRAASRPLAAQPSWLTVIATTVRLWLKRRASRDGGGREAAVTWRRIRGATLALVVLAAAAVGIALSPSGGSAKPPARTGPANPVVTAAAARGEAAAWISQQASRNAIVSCDPVMCPVLLAHGFPAGNLDRLGPSSPDPLASDLIVATPVLRSQFGSRLTAVYAPVTLARFGIGSTEVDIRVVAPDGSAAYTGNLRADLANRKTVGAQLLGNSKIVVDASARRQLTDGLVDTRLLATIATMADEVHPLQIVTFDGAAPGAGPGIPLRAAVVFGATSGSTGRAAVLNSLRGFLRAQQPPYLPASTQIIRVAAGQSVLRIQFAAPSPLGLLSPSQPVVKIPSSR